MSEVFDVVVPVGARKTFAYSAPAEFRGRIFPGMRVLVPFGRKLLTGYVVGYSDAQQTREYKIRPISDLLDAEPAISPALIETALWVSRYYFAPPGEVFRALFPVGTQVSGDRRIVIAPKIANLLRGGLKPQGLAPQEEAILNALAHHGAMTVKELMEHCSLRGIDNLINSLVAAQFAEIETRIETAKIKEKEQLGIRLAKNDPGAIAELPEAQRRLCSMISAEPILLQEALKISKSSGAAARALEVKGFVEISAMRLRRTPAELAVATPKGDIVLTAQQHKIIEQILECIKLKKPYRCLLHGVTGSGKTEVYLRLIAEVTKLGGTALFLVPEIGLTPMLSRLVVSRFPGMTSLLHSGMSAGERFDQWSRIREGASKVVVGTRSAVFAPLKDLRLIVIDEEQDSSYKQDESPCYHAREVAWHRARQSNGVLLAGSATPSIEMFYSASEEEHENARYFCLPERVESKPLPKVTIVDMTREFQRKGKYSIISSTLEDELRGCMERGDQAIILLNRRGFARTLLCRSCGHVFVCPDCSVSMTYHQQENRIICHYCGRDSDTPSGCENCGAEYIHYAGVGTEQLEGMLKTMFPQARIARLDRDTTRRRGVLRSTLFSFAERELDILVGTQMLAKGHDFPAVTMVGVVAGDSGLSFPDFRSAERTFQLLTQVAGRAGRGASPGHVVIQSYHPDNYALQFARKQDYAGFYEREIDFRRMMGYPPFRRLIQILISDPDHSKALAIAEKIARELKKIAEKYDQAVRPRILGPAAAPIEKLRGSYRFQILIKLHAGSRGAAIVQECFDALERHKASSIKIHVDVDPLSLL